MKNLQFTISSTTPAYELFGHMRRREKNPDTAKQAFGEAYRRYEKLLWYQCRKNCRYCNLQDVNAPEIVFERTISIMYNKAKPFKTEHAKLTIKAQDRIALAYLGAVALNESKMILRGMHNFGDFTYIDQLNFEPIYSDHDPPDTIDDCRRALLEEALETLKPMEQDILITYRQHADNVTGKIPEIYRQSLMHDYNLTDVALRKTHERAFKKIKSYIESKNQSTHYEQKRTKRKRKPVNIRT